MTTLEKFLASITGKEKPTQLQRYKQRNAPASILSLIELGGGAKMGVTLEKFARFQWPCLQQRSKGKLETGYDHKITITIEESVHDIFVEQKSSGHWGDDFKWQHVEIKHKWNMLLLCGIDYTDIKFWGMDRKTFHQLITDKKITNQGNKAGDSSEGMWFNYSNVKDSLVPIHTEDELLQFAASLQSSPVQVPHTLD